MLVELQDTVGKVLLLFLARRLVVPGSLPLSSSAPGLDGASGVYGQDVAQHALGRGEVHFWGAWCFGIQAAKGRRVGDGRVEARQRRRGGTTFMKERHEGLWSSEQVEKRKSGQDQTQREEERMENVTDQIKV